MRRNTKIMAKIMLQILMLIARVLADAHLYPKDPVKKVGDNVTLECRSPAGHTGYEYNSVEFVLKRGEVEISTRDGADSIKEDKYSIKKFDEPVLSQHVAGEYTCTVTAKGNGSVVNVAKTWLYVAEVDERTALVEMGKTATISCLKSGNDSLPVVVYWKVNGEPVGSKSAKSAMYSQDSALIISNTGKEDAFKNISCHVISQTALTFYKTVSAAMKNGAVMEANRDLSVVDIIMCKSLTACVLEAHVYGNAAVNISWMIDGVTQHPVPTQKGTTTISKTLELNITQTTPVELYVNGLNVWRKSSTTDGLSNSSTPVGAIIGGVAGFIVLVVVVIGVCYCLFGQKFRQWYRERNGKSKSDSKDAAELHPLNRTTTTIGDSN